MAVYPRGNVYWFKFTIAGRTVRESAKTTSITVAREAEQKRRRELELGFNDVSKNDKKKRVCTIDEMTDEYQERYQLRHPESVEFVKHASKHVRRLLGSEMLIDVGIEAVEKYQNARLRDGAAASTINGEVELLLRIMGKRGIRLRAELKSEAKSSWKLPVTEQPGKAYSGEENSALLAAARESKSRYIVLALIMAKNSGLRSKELRTLRWQQIDFSTRVLTVGKSKTKASTGRRIPLNDDIWLTLCTHAKWYAEQFGELRPEWHVFPGGRGRGLDPERPVSTLQTAWDTVREKSGVTGRWHDHRHTIITELAEQGESDQVIMSIAGHVSKRMLDHYSHVRHEAKRSALDRVLVRREEQRALNAERKAAAEEALTRVIN